jgi:translation initiation factor 1
MEKNKKAQGIVYSTNPEFTYDIGSTEEPQTLAPEKQELKVRLERKNRGGKTVTLVCCFAGSEEDLNILARTLKNKCGTGGSVKDGEIIIQGDFREKLFTILKSLGYVKTKLHN